MDFLNQFREFISGSEMFSGFAMQGLYNIDSEDFIIALEHYLLTGINVLDEHAYIIHMSWEKDGAIYSKSECEKISGILRNEGFWDIKKILYQDGIQRIRKNLQTSIDYHQSKNSYINRRAEANKFLTKQSVRNEVFRRYGKWCGRCGSLKNLTIDHRVSVKNGGDNSLENLRVLCRSCNSKKGAKNEMV